MKIFKKHHWKFIGVIAFLMSNVSYASQQQLATYEWPNGQLPCGCEEDQGIPKLIKSTIFAKLDQNGQETKKSTNSVVDSLNERFRSFIWSYVLLGGMKRVLPGDNKEYLNHIIGTLESFTHDNVNTVQGALCEWSHVQSKVFKAIQTAEKNLKICARGSAVGSLSIESTYGPHYTKIIEKHMKDVSGEVINDIRVPTTTDYNYTSNVCGNSAQKTDQNLKQIDLSAENMAQLKKEIIALADQRVDLLEKDIAQLNKTIRILIGATSGLIIINILLWLSMIRF